MLTHPVARLAVRPSPAAPAPAFAVARSTWAACTSAVVVTWVAVVALAVRLAARTRRVVPPSRDQAELVLTLSHEVRTPLNAVVGLCDLLLSGPLDAEQREQVRQVRRSGMLALGLVDDTLDRATLDRDELVVNHQPFALTGLLSDVVELLQIDARRRETVLHAVVAPGCPEEVRGDAPRIRQVLVNLVGNAVKFTEHGTVTVEVCPTSTTNLLRFRVTDTGTGIPAGELDRVFRPHARVVRERQPGPSGAGLGLPISQDIVRSLGGEISVTSEEGAGSVFGFELLLPAEPTGIGAAPDQRCGPVTSSEHPSERRGLGPAARPARILLAEDDPTSRQVCTLLLRQLGHEVDVVADGTAAVRAVASSAYDLVLLDAQMPGLDGVDAARAIRAAEAPGEHVHLVALTGAVGATDREAYDRAGMDGLIAKPVDRARLAQAVRDHADRSVRAHTGQPASDVASLSVLPLTG